MCGIRLALCSHEAWTMSSQLWRRRAGGTRVTAYYQLYENGGKSDVPRGMHADRGEALAWLAARDCRYTPESRGETTSEALGLRLFRTRRWFW